MKKKVTYYTESYKTAFLACLLFIGAVGIYRSFVVPHHNYLQAAQKYESAIDTLAKKKQIISNNLKTERIKDNKLQEQLAVMQDKLFDQFTEREFFSNIENLCRETNCKMLSLTFSLSSVSGTKSTQKPIENEYVISNPAKLVVEAKYKNIMNLMNLLQDNQKLVRINPVSISYDDKNPGFLKCDMTITIYVANEKRDFQND